MVNIQSSTFELFVTDLACISVSFLNRPGYFFPSLVIKSVCSLGLYQFFHGLTKTLFRAEDFATVSSQSIRFSFDFLAAYKARVYSNYFGRFDKTPSNRTPFPLYIRRLDSLDAVFRWFSSLVSSGKDSARTFPRAVYFPPTWRTVKDFATFWADKFSHISPCKIPYAPNEFPIYYSTRLEACQA